MHPAYNLLYLLLVKYTKPWPQKHCANESADPTNQVNIASTSLVVKAELIEPALAVDP